MLAGIRVIEMGQNVAGPHAAQILSDLGAEVIKVERPGGEEGRKLGPPFVGDDAATGNDDHAVTDRIDFFEDVRG